MSAANKTGSKRVAIYARYSTEMQDARSIDDQVRRCSDWAAGQGYSVVEVYTDAALSGASTDRPGLQRLMADATGKRTAPFSTLIVDDLSRLSRDLGTTFDLVFGRLRSAGVTVYACSSGMSSDSPTARLSFGANGLVNDFFLEQVKAQTHRGLEGRALAGFWTGGRVYGYSTEAEENPANPEHPRKRLVIDPAEADVVRRIFTQYAEGASLSTVAAGLNAEGLPSPYSSTRWDSKRKGWAFTTIREMLRNERYRGVMVWNKSQWLRASGSKGRRQVARPESEWKRTANPELAIISEELWNAVQERLQQAARAGKGRPAGTGKQTYLLSGLLKCGECGGPMSVIGAKVKNGKRYASFGCSAMRAKGTAICANALSVSESKITSAVLEAISDTLSSPEGIERFINRFEERLTELRRDESKSDEIRSLERQIAEAQQRARNLGDAIAKVGYSETLLAQLTEAEAQLRTLRERRTKLAASQAKEHVQLDRAAIASYLRDLKGTLAADPVRANAILAKHVGQIVMTPKQEGPRRFYRATGAFDLSVDLGGVLGKSGCGVRI